MMQPLSNIEHPHDLRTCRTFQHRMGDAVLETSCD
jgi:hypothetical protein